ncbi:MAG: protein phosphatase 2C domain-containing protein [Oceanicoccus sp.]
MITIIGATHPGRREHNEDCFSADSSIGLGLVADGMGGYACGELASELVKTTVEEAVANHEGLREAIARAHGIVKNFAAEDPSRRGMGSTAIVLKTRGLDYEIAWVGDSRAYLWDGHTVIKQITRDHSYVESLLASGAISYEETLDHPNRNLITQAVGVDGENGLEIGLITGRLTAGQKLLICSDGLVDEVLDEDIADIIHKAKDSEEAITQLITAALKAGGSDNITVVIATADQEGEKILPAIEPETIRSSVIPGAEHPGSLPKSLLSEKREASSFFEGGESSTDALSHTEDLTLLPNDTSDAKIQLNPGLSSATYRALLVSGAAGIVSIMLFLYFSTT